MIVMDVGGQIFRTTRGTLTTVDCFFSRMLGSDWRESQQPQSSFDTSGECTSPQPKGSGQIQQTPVTVFIDRDPLCFPLILSYLRSQRVFIPADADKVFLEKLLVEADYYQLDTLSTQVTEELARRAECADQSDTMDAQDVYRTIPPSEVQVFFEQGWAFVSTYEANETAACSATGSKVTATWRNNTCSVCGFNMTYDKFVKHASFFKPTVVVVKRPKRGNRSTAQFGFCGGTGLSPYHGHVAASNVVAGPGVRLGPGSLGDLGLQASPFPGSGIGESVVGGGVYGAIPIAFGALDTDISFG